MEIFLLVRLKGPDLVTLTAEDTLKRRMHLGTEFLGLLREEFYKVVPEDNIVSELEHNDLAASLLSKTTLLVNPNKHTVRDEIGKVPPVISRFRGCITYRYLISERAHGDCDSLGDRLHSRYGLPVKKVKSGILWTIYLKNWLSDSEQERLLKRNIDSENRTDGLLCNPHYEIAERIDSLQNEI